MYTYNIYIYVYIYVYVYIYTYIHKNIHTCIHTYVYTYVHTYIHMTVLIIREFSLFLLRQHFITEIKIINTEYEKILNQLESVDDKKTKILTEDLEKMRHLLSYNKKTQ